MNQRTIMAWPWMSSQCQQQRRTGGGYGYMLNTSDSASLANGTEDTYSTHHGPESSTFYGGNHETQLSQQRQKLEKLQQAKQKDTPL